MIMDLHQYYKENKDEINSSIMEIASELASAGLVEKHGKPFDEFVEPEDPDDPDSGTCYKEEYQAEFDELYDKEYERVASLMKFDIGEEDGIRKESGLDGPIDSLVSRANAWQKEARIRIVETLRRHGGRVTYTPEDEDGEYPVASSLYGKHDFPRIDITDVNLDGDAPYIMADGIDTEDGDKRTGFQIYDEQLYDIALFLRWVL